MAFDSTKIAPTSVSLTSANVPVPYAYKNTADTLATIKASAYFDTWTDQLSQNDYLYVVGSDGSDLVQVTSVTGATPVTVAAFIDAGDIADGSVTTAKLANLAVTAAKIANDTITATQLASGAVLADELAANAVITAKILDANVTLAKLATGIAPHSIIVDSNRFTVTVPGVTQVITSAGTLATDEAQCTMYTNVGTFNILSAVTGAGNITVTMSGVAPASDIITYTVTRAAS